MHTQPDINSLAEKWLNATITEEEKRVFETWYARQKPGDIDWLGDTSEDKLKNSVFQAILLKMKDE